MVEVPDDVLAKHVIDLAKDYGEYVELNDTAHEGRYGQHEHDTDWNLSDVLDNDYDVFMDDTRVVVEGVIEAHYSVKISSATRYPNSKAHPAEYESLETTLHANISLELEEMAVPEISITPY